MAQEAVRLARPEARRDHSGPEGNEVTWQWRRRGQYGERDEGRQLGRWNPGGSRAWGQSDQKP